MTAGARGADRRALIALVLIYAVSRALAYGAGLRFDLSPLADSWQILDPALLRHDLLTSVFYMPGQPPLYNLLLGLALKLAALTGAPHLAELLLLRLLFSAFALATVLLFYALLRRLGSGVVSAALIAGLFMCSPALLLYESLPYYTVIVTLMLLVIVRLFARTLSGFTVGRGLALFAMMAALIYTRSMFQIEWFVVLVLFCVLTRPGERRRVLLAAALPLLLIVALYAKNMATVGSFSTSDWMGMSLAKLTTLRLDHAERARRVAAGRMTPMALDDKAYDLPLSALGQWIPRPHTGIAVLDRRRKSNGHVNYNYLPFATVSAMERHDALVTIRTRPMVYLHAVGIAWLMFWRPASDYPFLQKNRAAIAPWPWLYAKCIAGQPRYPRHPGFALVPSTIGIFIALAYLLAALFGLGLVLRAARRRRLDGTDALLIFAWLNIMYVSVVGNALEIDENQRFRFAIDPLIILLAMAGARRALTWLRGP